MFFTYLFQFVGLVAFSTANTSPKPTCKAIPGTPSWPSVSTWDHLNHTLHGRLLAPPPPGAACHPTRPEFNPKTCPAVQAGWLTSVWHTDNPVSLLANNWSNDSCLPDPTLPCSGEGYPVYVVNATCAEDVKKGVDFARKKGVRLVVKGTGHDYQGRSIAPNALSIWTHHMRGVSFDDGFKPKGCSFSIPGPALTAAAGTQMLELDEQAHLRNLMIISGGAGTVGVGGYLTGGGHSALSSTYGLAADQVLEMEVVTPGGDILTLNECQHTDLFWAMRGGGGSTFGVMTKVTIKAFPAVPIFTALTVVGTIANTSTGYWDVVSAILSAFPALDAQGISGYTEIAPNFSSPALNITTPLDGFLGNFILPKLSPTNTSDSLAAAIQAVIDTATAPFPGVFFVTITPSTFTDFWAYYQVANGPLDAGQDQILGSRLVDGQALTGNITALKEAYQSATPPSSVTSAYLVGGHGVMNASPRGGGNAVNPAWRKAFVHSVLGASWAPLDNVEKAKKEAHVDDLLEGLRKLTPDMGAYVNEAYPYEKDWQHVFWGSNYERLLAIKKKIDPHDVLWCHPCVGNEGWSVVDDMLCKV